MLSKVYLLNNCCLTILCFRFSGGVFYCIYLETNGPLLSSYFHGLAVLRNELNIKFFLFFNHNFVGLTINFFLWIWWFSLSFNWERFGLSLCFIILSLSTNLDCKLLCFQLCLTVYFLELLNFCLGFMILILMMISLRMILQKMMITRLYFHFIGFNHFLPFNYIILSSFNHLLDNLYK